MVFDVLDSSGSMPGPSTVDYSWAMEPTDEVIDFPSVRMASRKMSSVAHRVEPPHGKAAVSIE